ncbi:MAG: glycosyltransferase family 2 protein [Roseburia sp.]|nr:glycosyltransferase family 2 protein [Roseburia sp.]
MRVAVMVACYNRKELTKRCLNSLKNQLLEITDKQFDLYVYDDGSTDGTYEMLIKEFPEVFVIQGKGNAYWCRSMYYLMTAAVDKQYDFYMMINDDVYFYLNAISKMFDTYSKAKGKCGVVGTFQSADSHEQSYGGRDQQEHLLVPNGDIQQCEWADWNCFLIDSYVVNQVGLIDKHYRHAWGDFDYDFRMRKKGIPIYETAEYIGECELNTRVNTYRDNTIRRGIRLKKLFSPKGLPFTSYLRYNIKIKGIQGFLIAIYGYCSLIGYIVMGKEIS